jgi:3-hydroxybutyryl-CoA dehydrogenase
MIISRDLTVKVIGVGKVGMSIVQAFAQSGFNVYGVDVEQANIDRGLKKAKENLETLVSKGKMKMEEKEAILSRMELSTKFDEIRDANIVIEAVFENINIKKEVFKKVDRLVASEDALLLTNTSSLSVSEIASVTKRPEKVAGMHFFNPVPVMRLVEIIRGVLTTEDTMEQVKALARLMGKEPIVSLDSPGFIVNRMLNALVVEATRIVEEGVGTIQDVDLGAKLGLGHPMGPFELFDYLYAIHLLQHVTDYMPVELDETFRLPVWVKNFARADKIGRNQGRGFYHYNEKGK